MTSLSSEDERRPDMRDLMTRGSLMLLGIEEGWWRWL